ncbi:MAG: 2-iminoacetate synthase ThiH [Candidatus Omnitrophota bacterium]|nr:2-iminoacetate synthase ThiH [Candidatus Omnitrophota bacterium]
MSYYKTYSHYKNINFEDFFRSVSLGGIEGALSKEALDTEDFISLLSPRAENYLEAIAQKAHQRSLQYFGKTIQLYTPLYLSNYCDNQCCYCGFNAHNAIERKKLSLAEVEEEAKCIASTGLRHILVLTGESRKESSPEYIRACIRVLKKYFVSISVEIYPLSEQEYRDLIAEGVDGLTLYQEVYDESVYCAMHPHGPKKDYCCRLDAPERGASAGMRNITIGALLGLHSWRKEIFYVGLHAKYLQDKFPDVDISVAIPRLQPHLGNFRGPTAVSDRNLVQIIVSLRLFLPRSGLTLSTRESPELRENLISVGITKMSAGSITRVGGHRIDVQAPSGASQFEIQDTRTVDEIKAMIEKKGHQPVLKDWVHI